LWATEYYLDRCETAQVAALTKYQRFEGFCRDESSSEAKLDVIFALIDFLLPWFSNQAVRENCLLFRAARIAQDTKPGNAQQFGK